MESSVLDSTPINDVDDRFETYVYRNITKKDLVSIVTPSETIAKTQLIDSHFAHAGWSKQRKMLLEKVLLQVATPDEICGKDQFSDYVRLASDTSRLIRNLIGEVSK